MAAANKAGKAALKQLLNKLNTSDCSQISFEPSDLPVLFSKVPQATTAPPASIDGAGRAVKLPSSNP